MAEKHPKRPRDPNQLAKYLLDLATGERREEGADKNVHAVRAGRAGGLKGGKARAKVLTATERSAAAQKAAAARWSKP